MKLTDTEFSLLNDWQRDFPLVERPYAALAAALGSNEAAVLRALGRLMDAGHISRIGAVFRPHVLGASTLAAVACPPERVEAVARAIDAHPEVNHNYEREHRYNLWFVVTAPTREAVSDVLADIRRDTGLVPLDLPMLGDFHIDLGFDLAHPGKAHLDGAGQPVDTDALRRALQPADYGLAAALEDGLPLTPHPFAQIAARCGLDTSACLARISELQALSIIRRFGVVVRHRELGYTANAMVVWDVPDARVDAVGRALAREPAVTLCYRRPRRLPEWPYTLFSMVHGRDRASVLAEIAAMRTRLDLGELPCQPLFSLRRFKQCGARYSRFARAA
ncbi:MAG: Lrp/AsnC family transcriptional regulator [Thiobacillus sp.]|nr:Lrp/AsnC family transcriptional regulator [Thiobacillus sp.]